MQGLQTKCTVPPSKETACHAASLTWSSSRGTSVHCLFGPMFLAGPYEVSQVPFSQELVTVYARTCYTVSIHC